MEIKLTPVFFIPTDFRIREKLVLNLMKIAVFLCCLTAFSFTPNSVLSQNAKVVIDMDKTLTVDQVFDLIKNQTEYRFIYQEGIFNSFPQVSLKKGTIQANDLLQKSLAGSNFNFDFISNNTIVVKESSHKTEGYQQSISGRVTDENGLPLIGVNILIKGGQHGTMTDFDGEYILKIPGDIQSALLVFSFMGYEDKEINIGDKTIIDVQMKPSETSLEEVVLTGYYTRKRESFTGAQTTIKGEELTSISSGNVLSALSVAEPSFKLMENNNFGSDPNRLPDFQIRGESSMNTSLNSEFKNNPNLPTFILDGFEVSGELIFDLDPNRVESITILKDAAATAIYGSRAANGVVIIETKRPKAGKLNIHYNMNLDFVTADLTDYDLMNAREKLEYEQLAGLYYSFNVSLNEELQNLYNERLGLVEQGVNTDWISIPVRKLGVADSHSLFFEGGDDDFLYSFSVNQKETVGAMKGSGRKRTGIAIKLQHNRKKTKFMNTLTFNKVNIQNSEYGSFSEYTYLNPYFYPYNKNGGIRKDLYTFNDGTVVPNYLYNSTLNIKDQSDYNNLLNNFSFIWDVNNDFRITSRLGINVQKGNTDKFIPAEHTDFSNSTVKGRYHKSGEDILTYDGNIVLSYNKIIKEKHLLNATGIYNISESKRDGFSFVGENYPNSNLDHVSMGTQYEKGGSPGGNYELQRLMGIAGNLNYAYDNRYVADVSVRTDASSIFGANDRWGTFFGGGIGWNLHKEDFFELNSKVQLLKLRASFGQTGGTKFNPFQSFMTYNYNNPALDGMTYKGNLGALLIALGNPDLKWQKNDKFNFGVDFMLFSDRLSGTFNYYNEISKNQLIDVTLAPSVGFPTYTENLGRVKNEGVELNLKYAILLTEESALRWDVFANILHNKNSLLQINNALTAFNDKQDNVAGNEDNPITKPLVKYQEGKSINTIWAVESLGIDPNSGKEIFVDRAGNLTDEYNFSDQKPLAVGDPDLEGNFGTLFRLQGFELGAYFYFKLGGYTYNQTLVDKVENVNPLNNADKRVLYDRWKNQGDIALFKAIDNTSRTYPTSRFIQKDNELRLASLNISYDFDNTLISNWGLDRLKLTLIANDLFRINTADIERGISYPFARYYSLNFQVSL